MLQSLVKKNNRHNNTKIEYRFFERKVLENSVQWPYSGNRHTEVARTTVLQTDKTQTYIYHKFSSHYLESSLVIHVSQ